MILEPKVLDAALARFETEYIDPDKAARAAAEIRRAAAAGEYAQLDGAAACAAVTKVFADVCQDKHLRLIWSEEPEPLEDDDEEAGAAMFAALCREHNNGVRKVEVLDGGIGYLDLTLIPTAEIGGATIAAAMQLLAGTRALIVDLRSTIGGSTDGVQLWCSYLIRGADTLLTTSHSVVKGTRQYWSLGHLDAPRYLDRPVYVLTGARTFSGGEDLAYTLQGLRRATLIGATTRGGAHPTDWYQLTEHVTVTVPNCRSESPFTGTDWEGVGVVPDLAVAEDEALTAAIEHAKLSIGADADRP
ncbi:peptidase S41 [Catenulispora acidiphila DSM 44928]|uniref:Peptidase S41 n=1 Tax=Catenulispora acidiphila (strain DSM 44928 / JCM 14897 / NBRC 102108 / NRRL B-24433 / ID139908) TaxID=479433 RepID=C7Q3T2_CATAD|nr:S41 family peptidase [Catenulispora acidiphila]ACU77690.1 peptidase S41 [Catenulispora acidiphila DSM 44928]